MPVSEFVGADFEFRDMRFEYCVARHIPIHAGIALSALLPGDDFCGADVLDEIRLLPSLAYAFVSLEEIRRSVKAIVEVVLHIRQQTHAAERLQGIGERADHEQACWMARIRIEVTMHEVHRDGEHASFCPFELVRSLPLIERRVSAP